MTTAKFSVELDAYTAEPDILAKYGPSFTIDVDPTTVTITAKGLCAKKEVISLDKISSIQIFTAPYCQPGLTMSFLDAEEQLITHKFWMVGGEEKITECVDFVLASKKLYSGSVLVAGYLKSKTEYEFLVTEDAWAILDAEYKIKFKAVGTIEKVTNLSVPGAVTLEKLSYAVKMTYDSGDGDDAVYSVFCMPVDSMEFYIQGAEEKAEDGTKSWTIDLTPGFYGKGNTTIIAKPTTIVNMPHLWEDKKYHRSRGTSFPYPRVSVTKKSSAAKKEKEPKEEIKEEEPKKEEPKKEEPKKEEPKKEEPKEEAVPGADAAADAEPVPKESPRKGGFRISLGGKKKVPKEEPAP